MRSWRGSAAPRWRLGAPLPVFERRIQLALREVQKTEALAILRERRSFRRFEAEVAGWG